jgi:hypothetical protein
MSKHTFSVTVPADADQDDCLAAAEAAYIAEHPSLKGYDLSARWTDDTRETVTLSVPAWHWEALGNTL